MCTCNTFISKLKNYHKETVVFIFFELKPLYSFTFTVHYSDFSYPFWMDQMFCVLDVILILQKKFTQVCKSQ